MGAVTKPWSHAEQWKEQGQERVETHRPQPIAPTQGDTPSPSSLDKKLSCA
jgi:hypothetical protein